MDALIGIFVIAFYAIGFWGAFIASSTASLVISIIYILLTILFVIVLPIYINPAEGRRIIWIICEMLLEFFVFWCATVISSEFGPYRNSTHLTSTNYIIGSCVTVFVKGLIEAKRN